MKEIVFLNTNVSRWRKFEQLLNDPSQAKPDILAELFIQITDDLAFSRTYYPQSEITAYLNSLAVRAHLLIYKNKKEKANRFRTFWQFELPGVLYHTRKYIIYSLIIFLISAFIGAFSTAKEPNFVRLILGDHYVNMTLENIKKGDPLGVYKMSDQLSMFFMIAINNIKVSFIVFIFGMFFSTGSAFVLFYNGVMVGCFQYFFYQHNLLVESAMAIWLHGTIEIFVIIVSGGAGILLGNGLIFPGTYSRTQSFVDSAKKGVKIIIGLIPFFIFAAFIESFITRYYQTHWLIKLPIILMSLGIIIWYFFIYPNRLNKHANNRFQTTT